MDIFGVSGVLAVAIPFVVNFTKKFIPVRLAPVIAFGLGIIGGVAGYYLKLAGDLTLVQCMIAGAGIGGTSTGLYDLLKVTVRGK